jgi:hypothetical protein
MIPAGVFSKLNGLRRFLAPLVLASLARRSDSNPRTRRADWTEEVGSWLSTTDAVRQASAEPVISRGRPTIPQVGWVSSGAQQSDPRAERNEAQKLQVRLITDDVGFVDGQRGGVTPSSGKRSQLGAEISLRLVLGVMRRRPLGSRIVLRGHKAAIG